jgi:hypothetical protein
MGLTTKQFIENLIANQPVFLQEKSTLKLKQLQRNLHLNAYTHQI